MAVRREDVGEPVPDEPLRAPPGVRPVAAQQRADVDLEQRAGLELRLQRRQAAPPEPAGYAELCA